MRKFRYFSLLVFALIGASPSYGKTHLFFEAGVAMQSGSAQGSGPALVTPVSICAVGTLPTGMPAQILANGANGYLMPSTVKGFGLSFNTGFHQFFPLTDSWTLTAGLTGGFTFLKASFTPKQLSLNGISLAQNITSLGFNPPFGSNISTITNPTTPYATSFSSSTASTFSFREKGYAEIAPLVGVKWKGLHFVAKVGYAFHLISMTPASPITSSLANGFNGPGSSATFANSSISLSSKGASCFVLGGGIYASFNSQVDLGIIGAWHVGTIKVKGSLTATTVNLIPSVNTTIPLKFKSRFQSMELGVLLRYMLSVSSATPKR